MSTSARMLQLLSLLQTHRYWPGAELAERLEVSPRTLRRDVERLRDLGYPVDAARGVAGGYQLQAGSALPPLVLDDDEAVAIAVGLHTAAAGSVGAGVEETAVRALAKVTGLMPPRLRRRLEALAAHTDSAVGSADWPGPAVRLDAAVLTTLAQACRDDEAVRFAYTARRTADGPEPASRERHVEPLRLVSLERRWYLVAYDRDRLDWRTFRVDRMSGARPTGARYRPRALPGGDAVAFVRAGLRQRTTRFEVVLRMRCPAADVRARWGRWVTADDLPAVSSDGPAAGVAEGGWCRVTMGVDDLAWPLHVLASTPVAFAVEGPPELAEAVAATAARFAAAPRSENPVAPAAGGATG